MYNVCIIGCGVISNNHILSLLKNPNIKITALCDIDEKKAIEKAKEHNLSCNIYTDYLNMLDSEHPDAVHILTPHYLHVDMTLNALKRELNVLLEKPMCIKQEDIEKLIDAEKNSHAHVCICFQKRYDKAIVRAKEIVNADGGVKDAYATVIWNRGDSYYSSADWRGKWETEGGGVLINQAIHTIDLLRFFIGIPDKITSLASKQKENKDIEVEDVCHVQIEFSSGKNAILYATTNHSGKDTTSIHLETKNHILEINNGSLYVNGILTVEENKNAFIGKSVYGTAHSILIDKFYEALSKKTEMPISLDEAKWATSLIFEIYKSNRESIKYIY